MKIKSVLASLSACAIAISAMAITASAKITNPNDKEQMTYALNEVDAKWDTIQGAKVVITLADGWQTSGAGGGLAFQGKDVDWTAAEFNFSGEGVPDPAKDKCGTVVDGNTATMTFDTGSPLFAALKDDEKAWAQFIVQSWWGADFSVDSVEYIYAAGAAPADTTAAATTTTTAAAAATTTTSAAAATTTTAAATTTTSGAAQPAGDAGVAVVAATLALAGAAAFVARKKD